MEHHEGQHQQVKSHGAPQWPYQEQDIPPQQNDQKTYSNIKEAAEISAKCFSLPECDSSLSVSAVS